MRSLTSRIQAQNFDTGGEGVAYSDTTDQNRYDTSYRDAAVDIRETQDVSGEYNVGIFQQGEWLEYTVDSAAGTYDLNVRVATARDDRQLRFTLGGDELTTVEVPNTGGWREWETVTVENVEVDKSGTQVLRVEPVNSGIDFNWFEFGDVRTDPPSGQLQTDVRQVTRPDFPTVTVFGSVKDDRKDPISGLTAGDFTLTEDGREQSIQSVEPVETAAGSSVSVSLVVDRSRSMANQKIIDAKEAAKQFISQLNAGDYGQVIAFDDTVEYKQRWTTDSRALTTAIDDIRADGSTALWEATIQGVRESESRLGRSAVIVLTDGDDNSSPFDVDAAIQEAEAAGVSVYTIGLGTGVQEDDLQRLADESGGSYYFSPTSSDLESIYEQIRESITTEYKITYRTSNTATDGTTRTVALTAETGGETGSDTGTYQAPCDPLPTAAYEYTPNTFTPGEQVTFDAGLSTPNGGSIVEYRWDFDNDGVTDATGESVTHTYSDAGAYQAKLTVEKTCGATDATVNDVTVEDTPEELTPQFDAQSTTIGLDTETTVDVVVQDAANGISAYEMEALVADGSTVEITNIELLNNPEFPDPSLSSAGSRAEITAGMGENAHGPGDITVARLTIRGANPGETQLTVSEISVSDLDNNRYDATSGSPLTLSVAAGPGPVIGDSPPQDLNGDNLHRDVDGSGEFNIFDVQVLFDNLDSDVTQENAEQFNFAGGDPTEVTIFDVQALFSDLQEGVSQ